MNSGGLLLAAQNSWPWWMPVLILLIGVLLVSVMFWAHRNGLLDRWGNSKLDARLVVVEGSDTGKMCMLDISPLRVGRELQFSNFVLPDDDYISNPHFSIYREAGKFFIVDENSTNGTFLNRRRLPPFKRFLLRPGAQIRIGSTLLRFERFVAGPVEDVSTRVMDMSALPEDAVTRVMDDTVSSEDAATRVMDETVSPEDTATRVMDEILPPKGNT